MDQCLLSLIVNPEVEDAMVDWLLERADVPGFTSLPVNGHGASPHAMSIGEQVAGYRRQTMFQIHLPLGAGQALVAELRAKFARSGMHYWLAPLAEGGHLD